MKEEEDKEQLTPPHVSVISQYIKDFSFENPEAPKSMAKLTKAPEVELSLDLHVNPIENMEDTFEVAIQIESKATIDNTTLFIVELIYAGIFVLHNIPQDQQEPVLAVHCPNMIFPFARRIISDITQEGGFQPLRIDPIDFGRMYQKKLLENEENGSIN